VPVRGGVIGGFGRVVALGILDIRRSPASGIVAGPGPLDLDHFGAQVRKVLRAPGASQDARKVKHPDTGEGSRTKGHGEISSLGETSILPHMTRQCRSHLWITRRDGTSPERCRSGHRGALALEY